MAKEKKEIKISTKAGKAVKKTNAKIKKVAAKVSAAQKPKKAVKAEKIINPAKTEKIVEPKKVKKNKNESKEDTGSVSFQIDNFSQKIKSLAKHLKTHTHDFDSRRGLLIMVGKRRRLLNYLKKSEPEKYEDAVKSLKLKA